jgi:hypothetical protein
MTNDPELTIFTPLPVAVFAQAPLLPPEPLSLPHVGTIELPLFEEAQTRDNEPHQPAGCRRQ